MLALVLFSSSIALLMYSKQNELSGYVEEHVEVYVTSKALNKGEMIGAEAITMSRLPRGYLSFTPLTKAEIIGRYATVDIFSGEPFRPEKLSLVKPLEKPVVKVTAPVVEEKTQIKQLSSDTISISLSLFKNIDHSLKSGEFIDIVSVLPKKSRGNEYQFSTKYIALHLPIRSFVSNGKLMEKMMTEVYDDKSKQVNIAVADTVILEISPKDIKNFFRIYYMTQELNSKRVYATKEFRGHLWMVKCSEEIDEKVQKEKRRMMVDAKKSLRRRAPVQKVSISYEK